MEVEKYTHTSAETQQEEAVPTEVSVRRSLIELVNQKSSPADKASYDRLVKVIRQVVGDSSVPEKDRTSMIEGIIDELWDQRWGELRQKLEDAESAAPTEVEVQPNPPELPKPIRVRSAPKREVLAAYKTPQHRYDVNERKRESRE